MDKSQKQIKEEKDKQALIDKMKKLEAEISLACD